MRITKYGHSCLLVEEGTNRILFDPGDWSFQLPFATLDSLLDITAILITHNHGDHAGIEALKTLRTKYPHTIVYGNTDTHDALKAEGIASEIFETGERTIAGFRVEAMPAPHDPKVLNPVPANTAYRVNNILVHPGDSLHEGLAAWRGTPILALPVAAPWANREECAHFAELMQPKTWVFIHSLQAQFLAHRVVEDHHARPVFLLVTRLHSP